jgi:hypothetical protein
MKYFGCNMHTVVGLTGMILCFLLTTANCYDTQPVGELLDSFAPHLAHVLGDGASNEAALQSYLEQDRSLHLLASIKEKQPPKRSKSAQTQRNRLCSICETMKCPVAPLQALCEGYLGIMTRIIANVTAQSAGMMVNILLGRPALFIELSLPSQQLAQSVYIMEVQPRVLWHPSHRALRSAASSGLFPIMAN